jgi:hypothetical protein
MLRHLIGNALVATKGSDLPPEAGWGCLDDVRDRCTSGP